MKTLLVLRHAKSSWNDPTLDDHERTLNKRGRRDAPRMGELVREYGLIPDVVTSSDAVRARLTAEAVAEAARYAGEILLDPHLYMACPSDILSLLPMVRENAEAVMKGNATAITRQVAGRAKIDPLIVRSCTQAISDSNNPELTPCAFIRGS